MNVTAIISLCFSGVMMIIGVITFFITQYRTNKHDIEASERQLNDIKEGVMGVKLRLEQVDKTVTETQTGVKELSKSLSDLSTRVAVVERDVKTAFIRIDELKEK